MPKERLDLLLVERNLVESRNQAQRLIMAGQVRVDGQMLLKAGTKISPNSEIKILEMPPFVSRGRKAGSSLEKFFTRNFRESLRRCWVVYRRIYRLPFTERSPGTSGAEQEV